MTRYLAWMKLSFGICSDDYVAPRFLIQIGHFATTK
jgi:hypothetical protein